MAKAPETLTTAEAESLLDKLLDRKSEEHPRARNLRNYTIAVLMLDAGLRVGEVVNLQIRDLVFNGQPVKSVTIRPEISKTKTERTVPLSERLQEALELMISRLTEQGLLLGTRPFFYRTAQDKNFNLKNEYNYRPITTRQVENIISNAALAAFGRRIHPHVLRHTFGDKMRRVTDLPTVQMLMGHKRLTSTQIYMHPNGDDARKAIDAMSKNSSGQEKKL